MNIFAIVFLFKIRENDTIYWFIDKNDLIHCRNHVMYFLVLHEDLVIFFVVKNRTFI